MSNRIRFAARCLSTALIVSALWTPLTRADDAPPPPPQPTMLEALFLPEKRAISKLPPFLGDTDLKVHFRSYYFNRTNPDDTVNEAYATGPNPGNVAEKPGPARDGWLGTLPRRSPALYTSFRSAERRLPMADLSWSITVW
jgi:hypothetical protein